MYIIIKGTDTITQAINLNKAQVDAAKSNIGLCAAGAIIGGAAVIAFTGGLATPLLLAGGAAALAYGCAGSVKTSIMGVYLTGEGANMQPQAFMKFPALIDADNIDGLKCQHDYGMQAAAYDDTKTS